METGTVKFFNTEKGFGFITPDNGGKDVFVHITGITGEPINEGDTVEFEMGEGQKGPCAVNVIRK
ncbi:MAG: cold-shock protein [Epsilonproteobacteria bacterium]|nr:MAG: cold-shock protein [Campylobacterota bacterium]RLA63267.1 MAG: cold-shock protein [Campylobacterota bacterium]